MLQSGSRMTLVSVILLLLFVRKEAENADIEINEIKEELKGVAGYVLVAHLSSRDHELGINNDIKRKDNDSQEEASVVKEIVAHKKRRKSENRGSEQSRRQ